MLMKFYELCKFYEFLGIEPVALIFRCKWAGLVHLGCQGLTVRSKVIPTLDVCIYKTPSSFSCIEWDAENSDISHLPE